ncbi:hypothetical protein B1199_02875 [Pseudoalteromonas ulvae]|uniref:Uncharacterized protein n=2 Tax=Pseudoalteromonas ulvae TaxID=107327 RepID=A0A244CUW1_PSEDV|nr:hypothetical protein B1199_02875 [Pseudoalteromonas ulvae]
MNTLNNETFFAHVTEHHMKVILDTGEHRHLRFKAPHTNNQYFDVITAPNRVIVTGDMHDFIWKSDFLSFSSKHLLAGKSKEFSSKALRNEIAERIEGFCADISDWYEGDEVTEEYSSLEEFEAAFREEVTDYFDSAELDEYRCVSAIESFSSSVIPNCKLFEDFWCDFNADVPTYHYLWCIHAVHFAVKQYRQFKGEWQLYSTGPKASGTYKVRAKDETEFDIVTVKNGEIYDQDNDIVLCINCEWQAIDIEAEQRLDIVNELINQIAAHGRKFFRCDGRVSFVERDSRGKVWFVDSWKGDRIYTHYHGSWKGFSHGGTLRNLVEQFRNYIVRGNRISINHICTKRLDGQSNIWGYSNEEAEKLINAVKHLPIFGVRQ